MDFFSILFQHFAMCKSEVFLQRFNQLGNYLCKVFATKQNKKPSEAVIKQMQTGTFDRA